MRKKGFTLIEMLIVVAILAILIMGALMNVKTNRDKAVDAKSKSELARLKIAFEDYYNDHNCYPPAEWFDNADDCGSSSLKPYLNTIPCDPRTNYPFPVEYDGEACGSWFKIYAELKNTQDAAISSLCDANGSTLGNYGVGSSNVNITINCTSLTTSSPTPTPLPLPSTFPGSYACDPNGQCNNYDAAVLIEANCPVTFNSGEVGSQCKTYCATATSARCTK